MKRRTIVRTPSAAGSFAGAPPLAAALLLSLTLGSCARGPQTPTAEKYTETRATMSTLATVTLISDSAQRALAAADAAFTAIDSVVALMNAHATAGDLARVNALAEREAVAISPQTFRVLEHALRFAEQTGGAFDVTVGPLIALWRRCAAAGRLPSGDELSVARAQIGYQRVQLDAKTQTVRFAAPGMRVDLGGIAKGYAIDRAVDAIRGAGITDGIVEIGGDLRCFGRIPAALIGRPATLPVRTLRRRDGAHGRAAGGSDSAAAAALEFFPGLRRSEKAPCVDLQPWPLGVQSPFGEELLGKMRVAEGGVATSGHYRRYTEIGGQRYSHIINPRSGWPVADPASVTVIAGDALTADALATAITVLGPQAGIALAESFAGVEALIITGSTTAPQLLRTSGFPEIEALRER